METPIPVSLVLGCNTPHGISVLSDWIEEHAGFVPDFISTPWSDNFYTWQNFGFGFGYGTDSGDGRGHGNGYGYVYGYELGDGYGSGYGNFNGNGCGAGLGYE